MAAESPLAALELPPLPDSGSPAAKGEAGAYCAALYEHPVVRWLLGGELHPGGAATTRRSLELIGLGSGDRMLDVACGDGGSALLAARERGCDALGVDLGERSLSAARAAARAERLDGRVGFERADAAALPFPDGSFDAVLCECSLSTFADKGGALAEIRRALRADGRVAVSDVVVDAERLPEALRGPLAAFACVGGALDQAGYARLLSEAGLRVIAIESRDEAGAALAGRVEDRLRGARLIGFEGLERPLELVRAAREAIAEGSLGYAILAATS